MNTKDFFSGLDNSSMNLFEMQSIRGGFGGGGISDPIDEDILLLDPVPGDSDDDGDKDD